MFTQPHGALRRRSAGPAARSRVKIGRHQPVRLRVRSARCASSRERSSTIGAIGPNVSCGDRDRSAGDVVEHRRLPVEGGREAARRGCRRSTTVGAAVDARRRRADPSSPRRRLVVQRAHRRRVVERVAEPHLALDLARQQRDELVAHGLVDEEPLGRRAALPRAEEASRRGARPPPPRGRRPRARPSGRCRPSRAAAPCRPRAARPSARSRWSR